MDRARVAGWLVAAGGRARRLHFFGISAQQRLHLAALLIAFAALPLCADDNIAFDPSIIQEDFTKFSQVVGQGIFPTPVQPARATGFLGFDIGIAGTAVTIDKNSRWWQLATHNDFTNGSYVGLPRIVASKGFAMGTVSASYAKLGDTGATTYGGSLDIPVFRGTLVTPEIALRGSYATIAGVDVYKQKVYGLEAFISKGFGPVMPYAAIGRVRNNATGTIVLPLPQPSRTLTDRSDQNRFTAGVRISLLVPKIAVEVTKAAVTSYAAKISFGF